MGHQAVILSILLASVALPGAAQAADPTTADCFAASAEAARFVSAGRLRAARADLFVCAASSACPSDLRVDCRNRLVDVNTRMPTVVFDAVDATGRPVPALRVSVDGALLAEGLGSLPISVDPGEHSFVFEAPGFPATTRKLVIHEGEKERHEPVTLGSPPPTVALSTPLASLDSRAQAQAEHLIAPPSELRPRRRGLGSQKIAAIVVAGAGVASVAVGAVLGFVAKDKRNQAEDACPGACPTEAGVDLWSNARTIADGSTIALAAGGVALAAAAGLWFAVLPAASDRPLSARVEIAPRGVALEGTW